MKLTESTLSTTKRVLAERAVQKYLNEGLDKDQIQAKLIEEGFGDFIRKGIDTVKKKTGLGKSMATRNSMEDLRRLGFDFKEMLEEYLPTPEEINVMSDVFADYGRSAAGGSSRDPLRQAFSKLPKVKQKVLMNPRILRKQVKTFEKKADEIKDNIQRSGDKTAKKATRAALVLLQQIEGMIPFASNLRKAFEEARKTGNAEGVKQLADQKAREHRALMKQIDANTRATAAAGRERDRQAKRDARRRDDKEQDLVRGKSTERFGLGTKGAFGENTINEGRIRGFDFLGVMVGNIPSEAGRREALEDFNFLKSQDPKPGTYNTNNGSIVAIPSSGVNNAMVYVYDARTADTRSVSHEEAIRALEDEGYKQDRRIYVPFSN